MCIRDSLVRSGRINKRKHELYELHINEQEAAVVRIVFDKYVYLSLIHI